MKVFILGGCGDLKRMILTLGCSVYLEGTEFQQFPFWNDVVVLTEPQEFSLSENVVVLKALHFHNFILGVCNVLNGLFLTLFTREDLVVFTGLILDNFLSLGGCGSHKRTDFGLLADLALPTHCL